MKLAIAGDSAGEGLAKVLADHLKDRFEVSEVSRTQEGPDAFYANLADRVASGVIDGTYDKAILVCGTGIGVCISANKVPGIRAALTHDTYSAERAALSNNAQIITRIAVFLQLDSQLLAAGLHDPAVGHDVHAIRDDELLRYCVGLGPRPTVEVGGRQARRNT